MEVVAYVWRRSVVVPLSRIGPCDEITVIDHAQRAGEKRQQIPHSLVIARGGSSTEAGHVCGRHAGNGRGRQLSAGSSRIRLRAARAPHEPDCVTFRARQSEFGSALEGMLSRGPAESIRIGPQGCRIAIRVWERSAISDVLSQLKVRSARSQLGNNAEAVRLGYIGPRGLCKFGSV